jgi:hypothetical protein
MGNIAENQLSYPAERYFDALKLNYEQQVQNLRNITNIDFKVFGWFSSLQMALGGYMAEHALALALRQRVGVAVMDASLAMLVGRVLVLSKKRRSEVVETLWNLNLALGYEDESRFIPGKKVNASTTFRPWLRWYLAAIAASFLGLMVILFGVC